MGTRKTVAIVQSCYIPWKGYFDLISKVDEFILYDDVQYTRRDWRNRNLIKTPHGLKWLTIPVDVKGKYFQKINETKIYDKTWAKKHWELITLNYAKAPFFNEYKHICEKLYNESEKEDYISQVNFKFLQSICNVLNIDTKISWSTDYLINDDLKKTERLLALCQATGATHYLSGPSASSYMQTSLFEDAEIDFSYVDYSGYPTYIQLFDGFEHGVTILDLIFNVGSNSNLYLKSFNGTTEDLKELTFVFK